MVRAKTFFPNSLDNKKRQELNFLSSITSSQGSAPFGTMIGSKGSQPTPTKNPNKIKAARPNIMEVPHVFDSAAQVGILRPDSPLSRPLFQTAAARHSPQAP